LNEPRRFTGLCRIKFADLVNLADFSGVYLMLSFKWKHFKRDIILKLVRWYLAYSLSYRDVEELALERGLKVDHSTIQRWVTVPTD
jgi:putative transposase